MKRFTYADTDLGPQAKFDIQLGSARSDEDQLAHRLQHAAIELKTERFQWEKTGNICIEYRWNGKPSGIATTEADFWMHELARGEETLAYLMFPVPRLKEMCRKAHEAGNYRRGVGDKGLSDVIWLRLSGLWSFLS
jgi:hypothetical protein